MRIFCITDCYTIRFDSYRYAGFGIVLGPRRLGEVRILYTEFVFHVSRFQYVLYFLLVSERLSAEGSRLLRIDLFTDWTLRNSRQILYYRHRLGQVPSRQRYCQNRRRNLAAYSPCATQTRGHRFLDSVLLFSCLFYRFLTAKDTYHRAFFCSPALFVKISSTCSLFQVERFGAL